MAAALIASQLVALVLQAREGPVVAVAQQAINLTPSALVKPLIDLLGTADKTAAVIVTVVVLLALGVPVGRAWASRPTVAVAALGSAAVVGALAVVTRPGGSFAGIVAAASGAGVAGLVLQELQRRASYQPLDRGRRSFLVGCAFVAVAVATGGGGVAWLEQRRRRQAEIERSRAALNLKVGPQAEPAGADLKVPGQRPWTTPNRDFYRIDTALTPPLLDTAEWELRIHGLVDREITLTYQDLLDRGLTDAWVTLTCVSNPVGGDLIGNARWSGVSMAAILEQAGVRDGADCLLSTSVDGWTCGTPLEAVTDGRDAILAVAMNGEPLPVRHGFPVRQVIPGLYGYVSATKWVVDWEVTRFDRVDAYWTQRGWGEKGPIKTESRIDLPRDGSTVRPGTQPIAGVAWHQHVGIEKVEVRVDGGEWRSATIGPSPTPDTWVQWTLDWDAPPGDHTIEVRATNGDGVVQTSERADVLPDGATGWHAVNVEVAG